MGVKKTQFVTLYSYKGGVGRTSALVNTAILRAIEGDKVVILDFDLEAPGVPQYLKRISDSFNEHKEGVLEYFYTSLTTDTVPGLIENAIDLTDALNGRNGGKLWAINAGNIQDRLYWKKLEALNWGEIFEKHAGEQMLANFKNQLCVEFGYPDYVFLDSRTGITEIGGVCTRYLADMVVILSSLNDQNIEGTSRVYKQLRSDNVETILVASNVPVGMPSGPDQAFTKRVESFTKAFERAPDIFIYHYPSLSLEECLPAHLVSREDPIRSSPQYQTDPLFRSYANLSHEIDQKNSDSYSIALKKVAGQLSWIAYTGSNDGTEDILALRTKYGDRLLAIVLDELHNFASSCCANREDPNKWQLEEYLKLRRTAEATRHPAIVSALDGMQELYKRELKAYLVDPTHQMSHKFEVFFRDFDDLFSIANAQISAGHYEWPADYFIRYLEIHSREPIGEAIGSYNAAHSFWELGKKDEARSLLGRFSNAFKRIRLEGFPMQTRANYYFCAAIAARRTNQGEEFEMMIKSCEAQLKLLKANEKVFSPITYKMVEPETLQSELSEFRNTS